MVLNVPHVDQSEVCTHQGSPSTSKGACAACAVVDDSPKVGCRVCRKVWHRACTDPPVTAVLVSTPWVCPACMAAGGMPTKGKVRARRTECSNEKNVDGTERSRSDVCTSYQQQRPLLTPS